MTNEYKEYEEKRNNRKLKNVETGEIKTYKEWIDEQEPKEKNRNDAGCVVDMMIFGEDLIPVV